MKYNELKRDRFLTKDDYVQAVAIPSVTDPALVVTFLNAVLKRIRLEVEDCAQHPIVVLCVTHLVYLAGGYANFGIKSGEAHAFCSLRAQDPRVRVKGKLCGDFIRFSAEDGTLYATTDSDSFPDTMAEAIEKVEKDTRCVVVNWDPESKILL